ncbi:MAG: gliding motility protein GldL [Bacteroidia bacterium]|nr:gliding motility protein GldL [Bacteroidia bacterium]MDW8302261.1 gliding motility protein GldL [Bacteroidia bacterium]
MASIGASIVIMGALFKLMHWPGAGTMLQVGMITEAIIFLGFAFLGIPNEDWDWSKVYPQLRPGGKATEEKAEIDLNMIEPISGDAGKKLNAFVKELDNARLSKEFFEGLHGSLAALKENTAKLNQVTDVTIAAKGFSDEIKAATAKIKEVSDGYATNMKLAAGNIAEMNKSYTTALSAINELGSAVKDAKAYHEQVQKVTQNLAALNSVYELEVRDAQSHLKTMNEFYGKISAAMTQLTGAADETEAYKNEVAKLVRNMSVLNNVYGSMLASMSNAARG